MDENEKIDLSALTEGRDAARFEPMIRAVTARGVAALQQQLTLPAQLLRWSRPVLAVCAVAVLGGAFGLARPEPTPTKSLEQSLLTWSATGHVPTASELFTAIGANHGP